MATPASVPVPSNRLAAIRRFAFWVLGADLLVMFVSGIWLAFNYEPGGSGLSGIHQGLGLLAVAAALGGAAATVADEDRSTVGIIPAVAVLAVIGALYLTGPALAWDQLAVRDVAEPKERTGIVDVFDDDIAAVGRDGDTFTPGDYRRIAFLHAVALPVAILSMGGVGVWAVRRRGQLRRRSVAESTG